ncbi:uncharacterized protein LOC118450877 isoform X2 [Vespa mandarinia]|uniref:uncharacterized protein LOC118450877 isoform X2 n=1 Tax=Vespa mandarinia TaxID=7446 RepID=UPI00161423B5|nr:uncharacterized protein LOC118450877 isoform X2 [Vespa mandarinia]
MITSLQSVVKRSSFTITILKTYNLVIHCKFPSPILYQINQFVKVKTKCRIPSIASPYYSSVIANKRESIQGLSTRFFSQRYFVMVSSVFIVPSQLLISIKLLSTFTQLKEKYI